MLKSRGCFLKVDYRQKWIKILSDEGKKNCISKAGCKAMSFYKTIQVNITNIKWYILLHIYRPDMFDIRHGDEVSPTGPTLEAIPISASFHARVWWPK